MNERTFSPRRRKQFVNIVGSLLGLALVMGLIMAFAPGQALAASRSARTPAIVRAAATIASITPTATANNVASLATVSASSQNPSTGQLAIKAVDGVAAGYPGDYTKEWASMYGKTGSWLRLSWAGPVTISRIVLYDRPNLNDQITSATITFSDGSQVSTGALANGGAGKTFTFAAKTVTWLKVTVNSVACTTKNIGLAEAEVWGTSATATVLAPTTTTTQASTTTVTTVRAPTTTTTQAPTTTTTQAGG